MVIEILFMCWQRFWGDQGKGVTKNSFKDKLHKNAVFYLVPGYI